MTVPFRLLKGLRTEGAASLASKRRGKPSNNKLPPAVRDLTMGLIRAHCADFGPTLAAEKLAEKHGCLVSRETLRKWMIEDGLWRDREHRLPRSISPDTAASASANSSRSTAPGTIGLRTAAPSARCDSATQ